MFGNQDENQVREKSVFSSLWSFVVCFLSVFCLFCLFCLYRLVEVTDRFSLFIHGPGTMVGNEYCCFDNETCARYGETCCKRRRRPPKKRLTQLFCFCYFFEPPLLLLPLFRLLLVPTVGGYFYCYLLLLTTATTRSVAAAMGGSAEAFVALNEVTYIGLKKDSKLQRGTIILVPK